MKITATIYCGLCDAKHEAKITLPRGWRHRYDGIDSEQNGFCPDHAAVADFAESQCPGCVSGWGDCPMWQAFTSTYRRKITEDDLRMVECGVCPYRTNGTIGIGPTGIEDINLSETAPTAAGKAFADAIRQYCRRWPARDSA